MSKTPEAIEKNRERARERYRRIREDPDALAAFKERQRERYWENREEILAAAKAKREANPEIFREYRRRHTQSERWKAGRGKRVAKSREYYRKNRVELIAKARERVEKLPIEKRREYFRRWYEKHREEYNARRRKNPIVRPATEKPGEKLT